GVSDARRATQRTARELLSDRARPERVREHAEAGRTDTELWRELSELGWPGISVAEQLGGQGLGRIELSILCEELGRAVAPVPFLPSVLAATVIEAAGSPEPRARWVAGLASGEITGARGVAHRGTAELVIGAVDAAVIVLVDGDRRARVIASAEADVDAVASIDPTRPAARVRVVEDT